MTPHPTTELVPYLRGELPPAERERIARHLADCPDCRADVAGLGELLDGLARAVPAPPAIHWGRWRAELAGKLDARRARPRAWWRRPAPLALSAGLAAVLVVVGAVTLRERPAPGELAAVEQALLGRRLDLLRDLAVVERLDLLEDLDVIRQLDQLAPTRDG